MKKARFIIVTSLVVVLVIFVTWPAPIDPVAYYPPKPEPLKGVLAPNTRLQHAELLALGKIKGPEEIAVDNQGRVYGGTENGKIMRLDSSGNLSVFANTFGRPLGLKFDKEQNLIVCDAVKGLLSINPKGKVSVLATMADGIALNFTDALDIASDGMIYFTDASTRFDINDYVLDLLEARPHGRFLRFNPATGKITQLLSELYFANGVALSAQEDFVLINETYRYRILRYWLKGPKAGSHDVFMDNLPGLPDNITSNGKGTFWLALFTLRNEPMDTLHGYPFFKKQMSKLPKAFWPQPQPYGLVIALNEQGKIIQSLHDPKGEHLKEITSAREHEGFLYMGSLHNDRIGKLALP